MSTSKIYNIGESSLSEKPKRGLSLLIKDGAIKSNMIDTGAITMEKLDANISSTLQILDKIKDDLEKWPTEKLYHTIKWGNTSSIVAVGDTIQWPTEIVEWNPKIEKYNEEDTIEYEKVLKCANGDEVDWKTQENWSKAELGDNKFIITFSYPAGKYKEKSNLGNERVVIVSPVNNGKVEKVVNVTYPWFINNTTQNLVKIGVSETFNVNLTGSPIIKVPFENSEVTIQADLGFGYMDVDWIKTIDNTNLGNAIDETVPYQVFTKPDSYTENIPHKITIKLIK